MNTLTIHESSWCTKLVHFLGDKKSSTVSVDLSSHIHAIVYNPQLVGKDSSNYK